VRSRREALVRGALQGVALAAALVFFVIRAHAVLAPAAKAVVPPDGDGTRFGVSLAERHAIFSEIAAAEQSWRARPPRFPGQPWSTEDDVMAVVRDTARASAVRHQLNLTQVYLIFDEGLRDHWPGPQGPLPTTIVSLHPRQR
jgi:hypothetical protein